MSKDQHAYLEQLGYQYEKNIAKTGGADNNCGFNCISHFLFMQERALYLDTIGFQELHAMILQNYSVISHLEHVFLCSHVVPRSTILEPKQLWNFLKELSPSEREEFISPLLRKMCVRQLYRDAVQYIKEHQHEQMKKEQAEILVYTRQQCTEILQGRMVSADELYAVANRFNFGLAQVNQRSELQEMPVVLNHPENTEIMRLYHVSGNHWELIVDAHKATQHNRQCEGQLSDMCPEYEAPECLYDANYFFDEVHAFLIQFDRSGRIPDSENSVTLKQAAENDLFMLKNDILNQYLDQVVVGSKGLKILVEDRQYDNDDLFEKLFDAVADVHVRITPD